MYHTGYYANIKYSSLLNQRENGVYMNYRIVFCFSGQGSHYYKMGKELYEQEPVFKLWMDRLDEIVRPLIGESVITALYNEYAQLNDDFDRTLLTHPAIFMFEYALYRFLLEKQISPDIVLGSSLGEFTSAAVAEVLPFEDVLKMVVKQAAIIESHCQPGGMMVLLCPLDYVRTLESFFPGIELSSINSDNHFVISGSVSLLREVEKTLKMKNITYQMLAVSHAFHSTLVDPAAAPYLEYLKSFEYKRPSITFFSCVAGMDIAQTELFKAGYFWDVCRKPIIIKQTVEFAEQQAVKEGAFIYLDVGPSGTSANLIKQNLMSASNSKIQTTISRFGRDKANLDKAVEMIRYIRQTGI
jgi:acyl transferase domain-containing protein